MSSIDVKNYDITASVFVGFGEDRKSIAVTDDNTKSMILKNLIVDDIFQQTGLIHSCAGNITVRIKSGSNVREVKYDHGTGIYLISGTDRNVGFVRLSSGNCSRLNAEFTKLGFSPNEIGVQ